MNERIRELLVEADPDHWHSRWYSGINPRVMNPEIKKFAELLIRECMEQIDDGNSDHAGGNIDAINRIKEHFGVEE